MNNTLKQGTTMEQLKSVTDWKKPAHGVWIASLGDMSKELRYTDLAAEGSRIEAINVLGKQEFPFKEGDIKYIINPDGRIMIRIPCAADEKLYGYGQISLRSLRIR